MPKKWTVILLYPEHLGSENWPLDAFVENVEATDKEDAVAQVRALAEDANRDPNDPFAETIKADEFLALAAFKGWPIVELLY
jgi:hypothetical protein